MPASATKVVNSVVELLILSMETYDIKVWIWHVNGLVHGGGDSSAFTVKLPQFCGNQ